MGKRNKSRVPDDDDEDLQDETPHPNRSSSSSDGDKSLYEIIGVEKTATQQEIKKAYYKLALRLHPDKNPGNEDAKEKFQQLQKVISILGDEEKRSVYDQTGCVDDADLAGDIVQNLHEYFKAVYKKVTEADIEEFAANYRGSDSEKNDLINLYNEFEGNMKRLFCSMLCSDPKLDSHRFKDIIDEAIASGVLKSTKPYKKWSKQISETVAPADPLHIIRGKSKKGGDLQSMILQRQGDRKEKFESMFSSLMSKYCGGESLPEPSEEEFEAARRKLEGRKSGKKTKQK